MAKDSTDHDPFANFDSALVTEVILCKEIATGRLVLAKAWNQYPNDCARRETTALVELQSTGITSGIGLFTQTSFGCCLIRPFVVGQNLAEVSDKLTADQRELIFHKTKLLVGALHQKAWVHRDLAPNNLIVSGDSVTIVDWDLAEKLSDQASDSFSPRGTKGHSFSLGEKSLIEEDLEALSKLASFLNIGESKAARKNWWQIRI